MDQNLLFIVRIQPNMYSRLLTWQSHSTPEYSSIPNSTPFAETTFCLDPHSPVFVINQTANAKNVLIGVNVKTLRPTAFDVYQSPLLNPFSHLFSDLCMLIVDRESLFKNL